MVLAIDTIDGQGLSNEVHHELLSKEEQSDAVFAVHFTVKGSCTLLTRWSISVLKVGVPCGLRSLHSYNHNNMTVNASRV